MIDWLKTIFENIFITGFGKIYDIIHPFFPKARAVIVVLFVGWICALLVKKITRKLLRAMGLDIVAERTGFKRFLERGGVTLNPSAIIGRIFYWFIIISAFFTAFNELDVRVSSKTIKHITSYTPNVFIAIAFIIMGILIAQFVATFVKTTARLAKVPFHDLLEGMARYSIIGVAIIMALEKLGLTSALLLQFLFIIFGVMPVVIALVIGVGGRDIISSILAGKIVKGRYSKGDKVELESISGEIESIDYISTRIRSEKEDIFVPNLELVTKIVKKQK